MRISVICPSLLSSYPGCAPHRQQRFIRAIDSFLANTYSDKEIIVISDGCLDTIKILKRNYKKQMEAGTIKLLSLIRHELFTGSVRQAGIDFASGDVYCNLDSDDTIAPHHLANIATTFNTGKYDWAYYNIRRKLDIIKDAPEEVLDAQPTLDSLCTGNVVWKRGLDVTWNNCDGRMDNKSFNAQLLEKYPNKQKLYGCHYTIRHAVIQLPK